jgi:hypothetical protein
MLDRLKQIAFIYPSIHIHYHSFSHLSSRISLFLPSTPQRVEATNVLHQPFVTSSAKQQESNNQVRTCLY